jgi:hypothetical protein
LPGSPRRDFAARNTVILIAQSSSVILVRMAGSLSPDTHRFEEKLIRDIPTRYLELSVHTAWTRPIAERTDRVALDRLRRLAVTTDN